MLMIALCNNFKSKGDKVVASDKKWDMQADMNKAIYLAKRQLPELVCDAVNLENIGYTLPEIQTLLDGITVGGHKLSDEKVALNQIEAWKLLFSWLENDLFELSQEKACELHRIAGREDALTWGVFRNGTVTIAGTTYMPPSVDRLPDLFEQMVHNAQTIDDIYDRGIYVFLTMSKCQFFHDVNKRMGRFMMNGMLLQSGYPAISVPAKRQLEFNQLMLRYYESQENDQHSMNTFMRSCLDPRVIKIMKEEPQPPSPTPGMGM